MHKVTGNSHLRSQIRHLLTIVQCTKGASALKASTDTRKMGAVVITKMFTRLHVITGDNFREFTLPIRAQ